MVEPFKNLINRQSVHDASHHIGRVWPAFERERFEALALAGLEGLEFKARAQHLCTALEATLPGDFSTAADILQASLAPVTGDEPPGTLATGPAGLAGWVLWPLSEFVARRGLDDPQRALAALHAMTQRFSAEFAIRPFIERHPTLVFDTLHTWARDPSPHVRRLVSEGSRPRLPWGLQLKRLIADPAPTLRLLEALQDDPSEYVRRSVANHLNDIAKDHPGRVADWLERHLPGAGRERRALLRHASRSLIKRGDPRVLALWGVGAPLRGEATLVLSPLRVRLGDSVALQVALTSRARRPQPLLIDYAVHHVKADGRLSAKVFKGWTLELGPGETRELRKRHSLKPITTRRYFSGSHRVELLVNGRVLAQACFDLRA